LEENRMKRYLSSSISLALSSIQDEIVFLYYNLSAKLKENFDTDYWENVEVEFFLTGNDRLSGEFPNILEYIYLLRMESMIESFPIYRSVWDENELLNYIYMWENSYKKNNHQLIYLHNLSGFMAYHVILLDERNIEGVLLFGVSLYKAVENYLPGVIQNNLRENLFNTNPKDVDFRISIVKGDELISNPKVDMSDIVIDLNQEFNLQKIQTYFIRRTDREFQKVTSGAFIGDHLYLIVCHTRGGISGYYKYKYYRSMIIAVLFALLLELTVQLVSLVHFKSVQNLQKEQEFMSLISHELNTPLCVISLSAENLSKGLYSKEKGIEYYGKLIKKESSRLGIMVRNILLMSNRSYSCERGIFRWEKLSDIISDLMNKADDLLEVNHISLEIQDRTNIENFFCCRHLLVIALFNILENGIRYGASFAELKIIFFNIFTCIKNGKEAIVFSIRDYGPGINNSDIHKIFRNFYRGHDVRNKQLAGSGLGLSLSRFIISEHLGKISLIDRKEKGTTFEVWLPIGESDEKSAVN